MSSVRQFKQWSPVIGNRVFIDASAVVLGNVTLSDDVSVWPQVSIRGDMHAISIGSRTSVQDNSVLHITHAGPFNADGWPLVIGSDVTIGHSVTLHGCHIGSRVLIGMGAIVMDGAIVEDEVVSAAGALVTPRKKLERGFLYAGSPAKQIRPLTSKELEFFTYSANNYVRLKDEYIDHYGSGHA